MYWSWMADPHPTHKLPEEELLLPPAPLEMTVRTAAPGTDDGTTGAAPPTEAATVTDDE